MILVFTDNSKIFREILINTYLRAVHNQTLIKIVRGELEETLFCGFFLWQIRPNFELSKNEKHVQKYSQNMPA